MSASDEMQRLISRDHFLMPLLWSGLVSSVLSFWVLQRATRAGTRERLREGVIYLALIMVAELGYVVAQTVDGLGRVAGLFGKADEHERFAVLGAGLQEVLRGAADSMVLVILPVLAIASLSIRLARLPRGA